MNQIKYQKIIFNTVVVIFFLLNPFFSIAQEAKIDINSSSISIESVFAQIEKQTDYSIAYDRSKIDVKKKISLSLKNASLDTAFSETLRGTKLTYKINGYHIILIPQRKIELDNRSIKPTQIIRGVVIDGASGQPIAYATIMLLGTYQSVLTDSLGVFCLNKIPIGRYDIQISSMGYESNIIKEVQLISAKESYREVQLKEQILQLEEIVVRPTISKENALNQMALTGGRMFSVEETSRFAGGFDDPARLITSFAGVSGTTSNNSISIRGNSPQFSQWRLQGIEIPNPTHFADMVQVGGGIITGLSSQVMGNSDFFNGAFPAEYSNAISGVFDMSLRSGNNQKYEHTFQVGVMGIDLASEGPINKKRGSSYIINYRYSITGLISELTNDMDLKFQDLSFKLNFPTRKSGTFSIWGLGLTDNMGALAVEDPALRVSVEDRQNNSIDASKFITGMEHKIFVGKSAYIKSSLAATYSNYQLDAEILKEEEPFTPMKLTDVQNQELTVAFNSYFNKKFNARHTNRSGVAVTGLFYDLDLRASPSYLNHDAPILDPMAQIAKGGASSAMVSAFSSSTISLTDRLTTNIGVTTQLFTLNNSWSLEPRISLKYQLASRHSLAFAYGLHSKREKLDYYYIKKEETGDQLINNDLTLAKANHFVLSYDWNLTDNTHLRVEPYYQSLYDVPVEPGTSFTVINHDLFYLDKQLVNDGRAENYGLDITLEQYFDKGLYWMFTGSLFNSKYVGGDGVWRNTRHNRKFITNFLIGKEWACGKNNQDLFNANIKFLYQGGRYYTPVNLAESIDQDVTVYYDNRAYSSKYAPTLTTDFTLSYKRNREKASHEFAIKILNATGTVEKFYAYYNQLTNTIKNQKVMIILPNISYKIHF